MLLSACNNSKKGAWSDADKMKFKVEMDKVSELDNLSENKQAYIDCYLQKLEANYSSLYEADRDADGCKQLAEECVAFFKSKKGAWTSADRELAKNEMQKIDADLESLGENKQAFIDCYLEKVEANYESFADANNDEPGCKQLAIECANNLKNSKNTVHK